MTILQAILTVVTYVRWLQVILTQSYMTHFFEQDINGNQSTGIILGNARALRAHKISSRQIEVLLMWLADIIFFSPISLIDLRSWGKSTSFGCKSQIQRVHFCAFQLLQLKPLLRHIYIGGEGALREKHLQWLEYALCEKHLQWLEYDSDWIVTRIPGCMCVAVGCAHGEVIPLLFCSSRNGWAVRVYLSHTC